MDGKENCFKRIKELKGRKRWEYLWTYYGWLLPILLAILLLFAAAGEAICNLSREKALSVVVIDAPNTLRNDQNREQAEEKIASLLGLKKGQNVQIDASAATGDGIEQGAKVLVSLSSISGNDVAVCSREIYEVYEKEGAFLAPAEALGQEDEALKPFLAEGGVKLSDLDGEGILGEIPYSPVYVCVLKNAEHRETAAEFLKLLCEGVNAV